jgi:hypothetical protein
MRQRMQRIRLYHALELRPTALVETPLAANRPKSALNLPNGSGKCWPSWPTGEKSQSPDQGQDSPDAWCVWGKLDLY